MRHIVLPGQAVRVKRTLDGKERHGCWCSIDRSLLFKPMEGAPVDLSLCEIHEIIATFPPRFHDCSWDCVFDTSVDGYSLSQFYRSCAEVTDPVVGLVFASRKLAGGSVLPLSFGCLCPVAPSLAHGPHHCFGSRETMVFSINRNSGEPLQSYPWSRGGNEEFMICSHHFLGIGGGRDGAAIYLDGEMQYGCSSVHCATFDSPSLAGEGNGVLRHVEFAVDRVIWFRLRPVPTVNGKLTKCDCRRSDSQHNCSHRAK
jgi:hypothetical protein